MPHKAALTTSLGPAKALDMWQWLMVGGCVSPLNSVESLMFEPGADCGTNELLWNHLKGSRNLSLQIVGWGRYLAERAGEVPISWQATSAIPLLRGGYLMLVPSGLSPS